ncbi:MAG: hypothetical protein K9K32_05045 [Halanaerobiales bacterium]|nr:hypothetical protein [Halanaerobiales bacterium]
MNNNYSMFKIKLKTGFFKKESYFLILGDQEIILRNESKEESEEFRIEKSVLKSVVISGENPLDIEIITEKDILTGEFLVDKDLAEAAVQLNLFCGKKLYFH